jgi:iron-sulfur cluster repair protein YtfE (RIC family)
LIRDYIAEHAQATDLAGDAVRAIDDRDYSKARRCVDAMTVGLRLHWKGEENGLFAIMRRQTEYADYITPLVAEHRALERFLATVDVTNAQDQKRLRLEVTALEEHISKEEDGLFPASLTSLSGRDWDESMLAWHQAHPGEELISD